MIMDKRAALFEERAAQRNRALRRRLLPVLIAGCFGTASANPVGPQVINGQVGISSQGNVLSITNTPGAIINWQAFSIDQNEITRFIQQNPNSTVLNRIIGQDPSRILGALQSNGRVFLVNPNGIVFGQGAQVDVNGLVASTLNISNDDFIKGKWNFQAGDKAGDLKNAGSISTPSGGQVYLIAPNVENSGIITSPKGEVLLAAGRSVQLVDSTNPDLHVVVSAPEDSALNLGQVIAQSGKAGIYGALISQKGVVNANSAVVGENGKIVFKASRDTILDAGSVTTATGAGKGGEVQVLGDRVGLFGDAKVNASGKTGGGSVLIGGDFHGGNPLVQNANQAYVGTDAQIKADAIEAGDGGKVVVWSDEATRFYGNISARGGQQAGNGGSVETSGKYLDMQGTVDTRASHGKTGTLLLDPTNIYIASSQSNATSAGMPGTDSSADASGPSAFAAIGAIADSLLKVSTLQTALANADVTVSTTNGSGAGAGNIKVVDGVSWSSNQTLTLNAGGSISVDGALNASGTSGAVNLTATGNITQSAAITASTLTANSSSGSVALNSSNAVKNLNGSAGTTFDFKNGATDLVLTGLSTGTGSDASITSGAKLTVSDWNSWSGANRTLTAAGDLYLNHSVSGGGGTDTLNLTSSGGNISQGASASLSSLKVNATATSGQVKLDSTYNSVSNVTGSAGTDFIFSNSDDLSASAISAVTGVTLSTAASKKIEINGAVSASGSTASIGVTAPSQIKINSSGSLSANQVALQSDSLSLSGSTSATGTLAIKPDTAGTSVEVRTTANMASCSAGALCVDFSKLSAATYDLNTNSATTGDVTVASALGIGSSSTLGLTAGNNVVINAAVSGTGTSMLAARAKAGSISQGASGNITTPILAAYADAGSVTLNNSGNGISKLAGFGNNGFSFKNGSSLAIGVLTPATMTDKTGVVGLQTSNAAISVTSSGSIDIDMTKTPSNLDVSTTYGVNAGTAAVTLTANGGSISQDLTTGTVKGSSAKLTAVNGVFGPSSGAFKTEVGSIGIDNSGSGLININNNGDLSIQDLLSTTYGIRQQTSGQTVKVAAASGKTITVTDPISASGGTIALTADRLTLSSTVDAGSGGRVELSPTSSNTAVDVVATASKGTNLGDLELSVGDLNKVSAGIMQVGSTSAGNLSINTQLLGGSGGALQNVSTAFSMKSGGAVTQATGATIDSGFAIQATGASVTLTESNSTGRIAGQATNGHFKFHSTNGVSVETVDGVQGITTSTAYNIHLESDSSSSGIGQSQAITGGGLVLKTVGPVSLNNSSNSITSVEADLYRGGSGTGSFSLTNTGNLTIDAISTSTITGVATNDKDVFIKTTGQLTQNQAVTATDSQSATTSRIALAGAGLAVNNTVQAANVELAGDTLSLGGSATVTANIADLHTYSADRPITLGATGCSDCLAITNLYRVNAPTIGIGSTSSTKPGAITVAGVTAPGQTALVTDRNTNTTRIGLLSGAGVTQTGTIDVQDLGVVAGGAVSLNLMNNVTNLAATTSGNAFSFKNGKGFSVVNNLSGGSGSFTYSLSQVATSNGNVTLEVAGSATDVLAIPSRVNAGTGTVSITSSGAVYGSGDSPDIIGGSVSVTAAGTAGIDGAGGLYIQAPLVPLLSAPNGLVNARMFTGTTFGSSTATATTALNAGSTLTITTSGSNIPLTFNGDTSATGNISVTSGSANNTNTAATITINRPMTTSGTITLSGYSVGGTNVPSGSKVTLNALLAGTSTSTSTSGSSTPPPSLSTCTSAPTTAGCSAVLPSLSTCTSAPTTEGCSAVLPTLSTCTSAPTTSGCEAVLPSLNACISAPSTAGCGAILPPLSTCTSAPTTAGCSAVLPSLSTCTTAPATSGCTAVLPTLSTCTSAPTTSGCSAVLPSVSTCTATPTATGCSAVLPTLSTCTSAPATAGCSAVLPTLSTCTSAPATSGCSAVLPSVSACTATPTATGCSAVLPTLSTCTSAPTTAGCSAVLPTLSQCSTDLALAGCSAVLPSISQCATNKDLPGCSVVLPTASKCTLNPAQAGCEVVLPPAGGNSNGNPNTTSNPTTDTIVTTSNVVVALTSPNDTTLPTSGQGSSGSGTKTAPVSESKSGAGGGDSKKDDSKKDDKKETVASQDEGAKKNDTAKKMYCN
jgi:filamentous hemagglutinin family protein